MVASSRLSSLRQLVGIDKLQRAGDHEIHNRNRGNGKDDLSLRQLWH